MTIISRDAYSRAVASYIRKGTPIHRSLEIGRETPLYVWRTRQDGLVRPEHAANEGRLFSWSDPPATGHPGESWNCRCEAIPYVRGETEYAGHAIVSDLDAGSGKWANWDFIHHFYSGGGKGVTLTEIGHLRDIVEQYAYYSGDEGAHRRLSRDIARQARRVKHGGFTVPFGKSYQFEYANLPETAAHGHAVVKGQFVGNVSDQGSHLAIRGELEFFFSDVFTDPTDARDIVAWLRERPGEAREFLRRLAVWAGLSERQAYRARDISPDDVPTWFFLLSEVGGKAYPINDAWRSEFAAEILKDEVRSEYK